jgi:large repetitive protein
LNSNGSFVYTPAADYSGADSFTYKANDGPADSNVATVSLTVTPVNDAPVAVADSYSVLKNGTLNIAAPGVLANDTDADSDPLTAIKVTDPAHGTLTLNSNGSFSYTPTAGWSGADNFTYKANDGTAYSNAVVVNITVNDTNEAPTDIGLSNSSVAENQPANTLVGALSSIDPDTGDTFAYTLVNGAGSDDNDSFNISGSSLRTSVVFDFETQNSYTIRVRSTDQGGLYVEKAFIITVSNVNDAPVITEIDPQAVTMSEDGAPAAFVLTLHATDPDAGATLTWSLATAATHGTATASGTGPTQVIGYAPTADFNGNDSFVVQVSDGNGGIDTITVNVTITAVNDAPVAVADSYSTAEDTALTVVAPGVLANDTDADSDPLTAIKVTDPAHGTLTLNGDGSFVYTPAADYSGPDSFTYKANDGPAESNVATVSLTVTPVNDAPVAVADSYSTAEDTALTVTALLGVLANDTDADGNPLTALQVVGPTHGTLTLAADGSFVYTPAADYSGPDSFTYKANDGTAESNVATVSLTVTPVNDAPVVTNPGNQTNAEGAVISLQIQASDVDIPANTLSYDASGLPAGLSINASSGLIDGTIAAGAATGSPYAVIVTVTDGQGGSTPASFQWTVTPFTPGPCGSDSSLVGCWPMEEGSGPIIVDQSGNGHNGTLYGTPSWVPGYNGLYALQMNGTTDYALADDSDGLDLTTGLTLAAWIRPGKYATQDLIKKATNGGVNGFELSVATTKTDDSSRKVFFRINQAATGDTYRINATTVYPIDGTWMHVAATFDGANMRLYINGTEESILSAPGLVIETNTLPLGIGAQSDGTRRFQGAVDDARVYNRALSAAEILALAGHAPVALADSYSTAVDTPLTVAAPGVLGNDTDANGDPLTAIKMSDPAHGTLNSFGSDGAFTYTPAAGYHGTDSFTYKADDGQADSNVATVSIIVDGVGACGSDPSLVGCWLLDEGSGPVAYDGGAVPANDATLVGSPTWMPGHSGGAISLNGTTQYGTTPDETSLDIVNQITLAAWVKPEKYETQDLIKKAANGSVNGYELSLSTTKPTDLPSSQKVFARFNQVTSGDTYRLNSTTMYPIDGTWIHAAVTYDGATMRLYINGVQESSLDTNIAIVANDEPLSLGAQRTSGGSASRFFQGTLDDVRVYNRALSVAEIQALVSGNHPPVANADSHTTPQDTALNVAAPGVLGNDTDADSDPLTATKMSDPAHGTLNSFGSDGSFTYTPAAGYSGADSFTYKASDGVADSNIATVSLTVGQTPSMPTGLSCVALQPKPLTAGTGEKPQSKVWQYAGAWWAVFPTSSSGASSAGTWLWKLDPNTSAWTEVLKLSDATNVKADVKVDGSVVHALLYAGSSTQLVSVEYAGDTYQPWTGRGSGAVNISLPNSEIATFDFDTTGRMWLATENDSVDQIVAYYSDSPYSVWNGPITLATAVNDDDIAVVTRLPGLNQIGVLWSNQNLQRFGFRTHADGNDPMIWNADEVPASQSALNVGLGMADDHLNVATTSNGTLYAAVKTSYDTGGYPKIALLVRRPAGTWDPLYEVDQAGTRSIVEVDEANDVLNVIFTSNEGYNDIVYKQSPLGTIMFGARQTMRSGGFNDASSTKNNYTAEFVVIFGSSTQVVGEICRPTGARPQPPVPTIGVNESSVHFEWPPVTKDVNNNDTTVYKYQVYRSLAPYFQPGDQSSPLPQNQPTGLEYDDVGVMLNTTAYYYVWRAANAVGPSADSQRTGKFTFTLTPGQ